MHPLLCFHVLRNANLWIYTSLFIRFVPGAFLVNWRCFSDSILRVFSYLQFLQSPSLLNFHFPSIYYRSIHMFYLHSKFDCSKKLVGVTRITGTVKGVTSYVILNHVECHNRVVITNAHATSILTCDRIVTHSQFLEGLKCESKWKTAEEGRVGMRSLVHNTLRGRGACWSSGMGLGRIDKLIHSHGPAHNPHNPLKSVSEVSGVHRDSISQSGSCLGSVKVHSLTLSYTPGSPWCDSRASLWPAPLQPLCLGREPKARVATDSLT
jgi:hypothetical protein